jgi:hypothetical protein
MDVVVQVEPGLTITGRVVGPAGAAIGAGHVVVAPPDDAARTDPARSADQAAAEALDAIRQVPFDHGRFEVVGLGTGRYVLTVSADGLPAKSVTVDAGARDVSIELPRGGKLKGRVLLPDGRPAKAAWVEVDDQDDEDNPSVETDEDGNFVLDPVREGTHRVAATLDEDDASFEGEVKGVQVRGGAETEGIAIRLKKTE